MAFFSLLFPCSSGPLPLWSYSRRLLGKAARRNPRVAGQYHRRPVPGRVRGDARRRYESCCRSRSPKCARDGSTVAIFDGASLAGGQCSRAAKELRRGCCGSRFPLWTGLRHATSIFRKEWSTGRGVHRRMIRRRHDRPGVLCPGGRAAADPSRPAWQVVRTVLFLRDALPCWPSPASADIG